MLSKLCERKMALIVSKCAYTILIQQKASVVKENSGFINETIRQLEDMCKHLIGWHEINKFEVFGGICGNSIPIILLLNADS